MSALGFAAFDADNHCYEATDAFTRHVDPKMHFPHAGMVVTAATRIGADGSVRCWWPGEDSGYLAYHDREWGRPVTDDRRLFEKLCLEGFQSGLSWLTILRKRENFRAAFAGFAIAEVAAFDLPTWSVFWGTPASCATGARSPQRSTTLSGPWRQWRSSVPSPPTYGDGSLRRRRIRRLPRDRFRRPLLSRRPWPGTLSGGAGASSARPRCTPSCSQWAW